MSDTERKVSVIIPVHDGERFLAETLNSVLAQDQRPLEVIVVDDGSSDRSAEIARSFEGIVLVQQERRGAGDARNRGVDRATGGFLAFLDADDLFEPGRLARQMAALDGDAALEAAFGRVSEFVDPSVPEAERASLRSPRESFASHMIWAMLIRRSAFERVGPFAVGESVEAVDWYARALYAGLRSTMLDEVVLRRRLHGANLGLTDETARLGYVEVAREALHRRRSRA